MPKIIGFTGTQKGMNDYQRREVRKLLMAMKVTEVHHGGCIGADFDFHMICAAGIPFLLPRVHPASDVDASKITWLPAGSFVPLPAKPALKRNHAIVDAVDVMIAAPSQDHEILRSGTWATIRYAHKQNKPTFIISPGGHVRMWY